MDEIPRASARVVAMNIGGEDFALDCDMQPDDDVLLHPKQRMIIAARAAGVMPLGFIATVAASATGRSSGRWCAVRGASVSTARAASIRGRSRS